MKKTALLLAASILFTGCAVDPFDDLDTQQVTDSNNENPEAIYAWLWAYDSTVDSMHIFHTIDKICWETFQADLEPDFGVYPAGLIGGGIYPTLWFRNTSTVVAFTNGILDHGDHGHIVHPQYHLSSDFGSSFTISDMSVSPDEHQIVICGSDQQQSQDSGEIASINYLTENVSRFPIPSPVSYIVAGEELILAGNMQSSSAQIYQTDSGSLVYSIATDSLITDGIYHESSKTAFLSGKKAVVVIDMQNGAVIKAMEYGGDWRINDMLFTSGSDYALGLCDSGDRLFVIDMKNQILNQYIIPGATLCKSIHKGTVVLSNDGTKAILADLVRPVLYRITLSDGITAQATAPDSSCPLACNYDGTRVWALARSKIYQVSFERDAVVDSISVSSKVTWIMASSFRDNGSLFDSNDHTF